MKSKHSCCNLRINVFHSDLLHLFALQADSSQQQKVYTLDIPGTARLKFDKVSHGVRKFRLILNYLTNVLKK